MVMEFETTATEPHATNVDVEMDGGDCIDDEMEATQRFEDEPAEVETAGPSTPAAKATPVVTTPTAAEPEADGSFEVAGASESAKPFAAAFGTVWQVLLSLGWQTAQGPGTEFVSMPGTQFFNFRPNINVFDSKGKACWKWLASAADREPTPTEEEPVWETLWTIAEKQFGWYTMSSGNETWFVKPNTQFTEFQPNVTIFQTKKRAVLQALAINKVKVELGDSVEGTQVIDFAAKPEESKPKAKKEKSTETPNKSKVKSDSFTTPPPKKSAASASSSGKKTLTSSGKKAGKSPGSGKKATTPAKKNVKSPKTPKSAKKSADQDAEAKPKPEPPLQFHVPEFKCTFAHVYKTLQERGWHHKPGSFEYDYFSPDYTKETQILNGNYFQSAAEFEGFLKDSGMWADIEAELREEHAALVEELRQEAEEKRQKLKERQAAREATEKAKAKTKATPAKEVKTPRSPLKKKKKSAFSASIEASKALAASSGTKREVPKEVKITMGKVVEKLVKRGWHYRPGRFEYDYFKPNVTIKNGKAGEDYFQSLSELEEYLKTTELWDEISYEIRNGSEDDDDEEEDTRKKATPPPAKKQRVEPQVAKSPREEKRSPTEPLEPAAAALSNDIWGNSHQIDFEKY